jgi:hypothetical protein
VAAAVDLYGNPSFLSQSDGAAKGFTPAAFLTVIMVAELLVS